MNEALKIMSNIYYMFLSNIYTTNFQIRTSFPQLMTKYPCFEEGDPNFLATDWTHVHVDVGMSSAKNLSVFSTKLLL